MDVLLIRPEGPYARASMGNRTTLTETSVKTIDASVWQVEEISRMRLGTVILEDLHLHDIADGLREAILKGSAGQSCPIVTRWTYPRQGDAR